jgi:hypothetical protein
MSSRHLPALPPFSLPFPLPPSDLSLLCRSGVCHVTGLVGRRYPDAALLHLKLDHRPGAGREGWREGRKRGLRKRNLAGGREGGREGGGEGGGLPFEQIHQHPQAFQGAGIGIILGPFLVVHQRPRQAPRGGVLRAEVAWLVWRRGEGGREGAREGRRGASDAASSRDGERKRRKTPPLRKG